MAYVIADSFTSTFALKSNGARNSKENCPNCVMPKYSYTISYHTVLPKENLPVLEQKT